MFVSAYHTLEIHGDANDQDIIDAYYRKREYVNRTYAHGTSEYNFKINDVTLALSLLSPFGCGRIEDYEHLRNQAIAYGNPSILWDNARYIFTPEEAAARKQYVSEQRFEMYAAETRAKEKNHKIILGIVAAIVLLVLLWHPITALFVSVAKGVGYVMAAVILLPLIGIMAKAI